MKIINNWRKARKKAKEKENKEIKDYIKHIDYLFEHDKGFADIYPLLKGFDLERFLVALLYLNKKSNEDLLKYSEFLKEHMEKKRIKKIPSSPSSSDILNEFFGAFFSKRDQHPPKKKDNKPSFFTWSYDTSDFFK